VDVQFLGLRLVWLPNFRAKEAVHRDVTYVGISDMADMVNSLASSDKMVVRVVRSYSNMSLLRTSSDTRPTFYPRYPWEVAPVKYHAAYNVSINNLWVDKCPVSTCLSLWYFVLIFLTKVSPCCEEINLWSHMPMVQGFRSRTRCLRIFWRSLPTLRQLGRVSIIATFSTGCRRKGIDVEMVWYRNGFGMPEAGDCF